MKTKPRRPRGGKRTRPPRSNPRAATPVTTYPRPTAASDLRTCSAGCWSASDLGMAGGAGSRKPRDPQPDLGLSVVSFECVEP